MSSSVNVSGKGLRIEDVVAVARHGVEVRLDPDARERIAKCRAMLERKIAEGETMYGVNTGIGEFSEIALDSDQTRQFQRYLIYNHSAGIGAPAPVEHVRAAMLSRINVHSHGHSGCRPQITELMVDMLNRGVTPVVAEKGSVGACGDLAPMSQVALAMMGEGEAWYEGELLPSAEALSQAGLVPITLEARDGLAIINGSNLITGIACLLLYDCERWLGQAEIAACLSLEALTANLRPYEGTLHKLRGHHGAQVTSANLCSVMGGSDLMTGKMQTRVQDAYSMRSTPQVIGAARDQLRWTREQVETELNGVCDNPIFLPDEDRVLTGANFQGTPIAMPLDMLGAAVCVVSVLSERRLNRLLNPALSAGLPDFLTAGAGMYSGFMVSQYTADSLIVEQRMLSAPASIQSIPAAADQEDFVSMGMNSALKTKQILINARGVLGIELMAGAQALDFRDFSPGKGTSIAKACIREKITHLEEDRPLFRDHDSMAELVAECGILEAVEEACGALRKSWL